MVSVGLLVATLIGTVVYRAIAAQLPRTAELWFFGVVSVLFFTAALDIVALARSVMFHGVARARGLKVRDLQAGRGRDRMARLVTSANRSCFARGVPVAVRLLCALAWPGLAEGRSP
jgi:hypothetical protein